MKRTYMINNGDTQGDITNNNNNNNNNNNHNNNPQTNKTATEQLGNRNVCFGLVRFNDISTVFGYFMLNPLFIHKY